MLGSISEREEEQIIKPFALNFCGFKSSKTGYSQKRYTVHSLGQFHTGIEPGTTDNKSRATLRKVEVYESQKDNHLKC